MCEYLISNEYLKVTLNLNRFTLNMDLLTGLDAKHVHSPRIAFCALNY